MKIGYLTPEYPHPKTGNYGGIGTSLKNLAAGLTRKGHQVVIVVYGQKADGILYDENVEIYTVKNRKLKGISWWLTQKKVQRLLLDLFKQGKIELVEAADWTGFTSFINTPFPLGLRLHGSDTYFCHMEKRPVKRFNYFLEKRAYRRADYILSVSAFTARLSNELFLQNRKYTVIHNGIDIQRFSDETFWTEEPVVLYFGALIRKKGVLEIPFIFKHVWQKNPQAKLVLVGKDVKDYKTQTSTWELMKKDFGDETIQHVTYLGSVPYSEIKNYIRQSGVCIFPSFAEAFPVSWLEAMSMQKAIVASDIGWAKEVIEDGVSGFLTDPTQHKQFADKILELLSDTDKNKKIGKEARLRVIGQFDAELIAEENIKFYQSILHHEL